jgi:antitoxin component YwqK of YwqJK toxin-antitoxin module
MSEPSGSLRRVREEELDYPGDDGLYYLDGEPFTGLAVTYDGPRLRSEVEYRDGVGWGTIRTWHASGAPASEKQCVAGVFHGLCMERDERGQFTLYAVYELGICVWQRRWAAGQLVEDRQVAETDGDYRTLQMLRTHFMQGLQDMGRG